MSLADLLERPEALSLLPATPEPARGSCFVLGPRLWKRLVAQGGREWLLLPVHKKHAQQAARAYRSFHAKMLLPPTAVPPGSALPVPPPRSPDLPDRRQCDPCSLPPLLSPCSPPKGPRIRHSHPD